MGYRTKEKTSVENPCRDYAKSQGVDSLKVNTQWSASWPDRMFFIPGGRPLMIEFKRPGGKLTPKQAAKINKLKEDGYDVHVIDDKAEGISLIRSRLESSRVHATSDEVGAGTPVRRPVPRPRAKKD